MPQRSPVADYLDAVTRELGFDRPLAHRVRQEVEDHLWEATAANGGSSIEAQARAVRCFGEAREIARRFAVLHDLIGPAAGGVSECWARGTGRAARLLALAYVGMWVSYYAAIARGVDPWPVPLLDEVKRRLA